MIFEYMEREEKRKALVSVLKYLLENDKVENDAAIGICRQIIGGSSLDDLTEKQKYRFEQDVSDFVDVACEGHCDGMIDIEYLKNAYMRDDELGGLYCQHCAYDLE